MLELSPAGLYCRVGDFHVDPWQPVQRAVITHAHADHLVSDHGTVWIAAAGAGVAARRAGAETALETLAYGEPRRLGEVEVSLHPAGHVLGSAQVRLANSDCTWVVTGDFKRAPDPTCTPFAPVACDTLVTEATFALPVFRWPEPEAVIADIHAWWTRNAAAGVPSVLFCYAFGKAQRVLAALAAHTENTVYTHGAVEAVVALYRDAGVTMLPTEHVDAQAKGAFREALVIAPPSAAGTPWMRRFGRAATAFCSGWMRIRGNRRRRAFDRGFVLSDHADWPALLATVRDSGARRVLTTHGYAEVFARYLREQEVEAEALETAFRGEEGAA